MTAIARIAVISAVFYLVRFALAHQQRTQSKCSDSDSAYSLQEDSVSGYEESNEKVLIRSGVPLRGRTIHQTAWSEEERVSVSGKDTLQQPSDQNTKEKFYDGWSLTNTINYILSFIYDTEIEGNGIISNNLPENSNENVELPKNNLEERKAHQTSTEIDNPKEKLENIQIFNKDSVLKTTTDYPIGILQNQDIEWFRNEISSLSDEYIYTESDIENNEFSNENLHSEYEEALYKHEDYEMINKVDQMHDIGSVITDTKDESTRNNMAKPSSVIREKEPKLVYVAKSKESDHDSDKNTDTNYKNGNIHSGNTKPDFGQNKKMDNNGYGKNIFQSTDHHPKQQSQSETMKGIFETRSLSEHTNSSPESHSDEDVSSEKSMKEEEENDGGNDSAPTRKTSSEKIVIKIPPITSHLQNQAQPAIKELSNILTEKPKVLFDKNKQGKKHEVNRLFSTTANFNELQHEKGFKQPNYGTKTTVTFSDRAQMNHQFKVSSNNDKKDMDYKSTSIPQNKPVRTHFKTSQFPNIKPLTHRDQKHLKTKQRYLSDIYLDLEPDEDVRSYNYLLDSYEFIRIDKNNNKINKKHDNSIYVISQDKELGSKKNSPIFSAPLTPPFKDQKEVEVIDKPHENFDTFLQYLYKNSNSSFILSLKEHNSTET